MKKLLWKKVCNQHFQCNRLEVSHSSQVYLHTHDFYEFFIIESGFIEHQINDKTISMKQGQGWWIKPEDAHRFTLPKERSAIVMNFAFPTSYCREFYEIDPQSIHFLEESSRHSQPLSFSSTNFSALLALMKEAISCSNTRIHFHRMMSSALVLLSPEEKKGNTFFPRDWSIYQENRRNDLPHWLALLIQKLESPEFFLQGVVKIQQLSGYSPSHFCQIFKSYLGVTPTDYINEKRMVYAKRLIEESERSVLDIIGELHFNNIPYFYRLFKRHFGIAPNELRSTIIHVSKNK